MGASPFLDPQVYTIGYGGGGQMVCADTHSSGEKALGLESSPSGLFRRRTVRERR
ncbi:hypothetical protein MJA45_06155 [Paenibacillus aurantius]|uniref:Uncharacterized protein n=1 Tax=Paenibacillus aurantius TaxID=2918900 RepID=A0AA96RGK3_9BACL|nr:hypothetical protein [Paenibacillus aurantius]WNQ12611.1 hypothetical protein MJA45_06155 [Paenibacillus aurantius]